jgi:hypothetical protein
VQSFSSCAPPPASPASGATKASAAKLAICLRLFTAGSPKVSTYQSCRTPRRCSTRTRFRRYRARLVGQYATMLLRGARSVEVCSGGGPSVLLQPIDGEPVHDQDRSRASRAGGSCPGRVKLQWLRRTCRPFLWIRIAAIECYLRERDEDSRRTSGPAYSVRQIIRPLTSSHTQAL